MKSVRPFWKILAFDHIWTWAWPSRSPWGHWQLPPPLIWLATYQSTSVPILVLLSKSAQFGQKWQLIRSTNGVNNICRYGVNSVVIASGGHGHILTFTPGSVLTFFGFLSARSRCSQLTMLGLFWSNSFHAASILLTAKSCSKRLLKLCFFLL